VNDIYAWLSNLNILTHFDIFFKNLLAGADHVTVKKNSLIITRAFQK